MTRRRWLALAVGLAVLVACVGLAIARPGGGESYSGGGGHGGGGGGGGGGDGEGILALIELIYYIVVLTIDYPHVMLPLLGGVGVYVAYSAWKQKRNKDWDSGPPKIHRPAATLNAIRNIDPDFSRAVFEDFAFRLISAAHRARTSPDGLAGVAPYVSGPARAQLAGLEPVGVPIQQVIVGAMRAYRVDLPSNRTDPDASVHIGLEIEANIATAESTYFVVENWQLSRAASARTKAPGVSRTFPCPNCGAPWQATGTGTQKCASCGEIVDNGRFDWIVEDISRSSTDPRPPTLTTEVPERGTDLPTYIHQDAAKRFRALHAKDPAVDQQTLDRRITLIHREISAAWSKNDLAPIRGLVSDGMYDYLDYWVQAYKQQGLRNEMRDVRITRTELAKVVRDRWYDSVTMRIWATGKDYVIEDASGRVVKGSKSRERPYSEYWTLIRSADRTGAPKGDRSCGNCGAPLEVTMAGACNYCGAHVTAGEFDWVLSKIEQDDSYRG